MSDKIVKNLNFGDEAKEKIFNGIDKLTKAVSSTLGS
jgi:chaperonin GroEL (HSP60 family)